MRVRENYFTLFEYYTKRRWIGGHVIYVILHEFTFYYCLRYHSYILLTLLSYCYGLFLNSLTLYMIFFSQSNENFIRLIHFEHLFRTSIGTPSKKSVITKILFILIALFPPAPYGYNIKIICLIRFQCHNFLVNNNR